MWLLRQNALQAMLTEPQRQPSFPNRVNNALFPLHWSLGLAKHSPLFEATWGILPPLGSPERRPSPLIGLDGLIASLSVNVDHLCPLLRKQTREGLRELWFLCVWGEVN